MEVSQNENPVCPKCGSKSHKNGKRKGMENNRQYKCSKCKHSWDVKKFKYTKEEIKESVQFDKDSDLYFHFMFGKDFDQETLLKFGKCTTKKYLAFIKRCGIEGQAEYKNKGQLKPLNISLKKLEKKLKLSVYQGKTNRVTGVLNSSSEGEVSEFELWMKTFNLWKRLEMSNTEKTFFDNLHGYIFLFNQRLTIQLLKKKI